MCVLCQCMRFLSGWTFSETQDYCSCQGRKSSWTELNELNWTNWTDGGTWARSMNWTELNGSQSNEAGELNWTELMPNLFELNLRLTKTMSIWTELVNLELNWGTWCCSPNWTELNGSWSDQASELNWTELMSNHCELWTRRLCKFTNSSGPGSCISAFYLCIGRYSSCPPAWPAWLAFTW